MRSRRLLDVLVGVYVSIIVVTASALVRWEAVAPTFSAGSAVAVGLAIAAVVALIAGTISDLVEGVTSRLAMVVTGGLPLVYLVYLIFVLEPGSTHAFVAGVGTFALVVAVGIGPVAKRITTRRLRDASTEITAVTAGAYEGTALRRWLHIGKNLYTTGFLALLIGAIVLVGLENTRIQFLISFGAVGIGGFGFIETKLLEIRGDDGSMIVVTDMGLRGDRYTQGWVSQRFVRWDECEGYRITKGTVEIVFSRRFPEKWTLYREEISDEAALIDALDDYLPRLDDERPNVTVSDANSASTIE